MESASLILFVGLVQGALLGFSVLLRNPRSAAMWCLAGLLLAVGGSLILPLMQPPNGVWPHPRLVLWLGGLPFLFGPLLLAHVALQVRDRSPISGFWLWLHAVLPLAYLMLVLWLSRLDSNELGNMLTPSDDGARWGLLPVLKHASLLGYGIASLLLLQRHYRRLRQSVAEIEPFQLRWLAAMVWLLLLLGAVMLFLPLLDLSAPQTDLLLGMLVSLMMVLAAFHGLRRPAVLDAWPEAPEPASLIIPASAASRDDTPSSAAECGDGGQPETEAAVNNPSSLLDAERAAVAVAALQQLNARDDLLFDHLLDLTRLARALGLTTNQLSYVLNARMGVSFYAFINRLRAQAVAKRLVDSRLDHLPILDIAFGCGFSTKTTFNKAFKTEMGVTPSTYRRQQRASAPQNPAGK